VTVDEELAWRRGGKVVKVKQWVAQDLACLGTASTETGLDFEGRVKTVYSFGPGTGGRLLLGELREVDISVNKCDIPPFGVSEPGSQWTDETAQLRWKCES